MDEEAELSDVEFLRELARILSQVATPSHSVGIDQYHTVRLRVIALEMEEMGWSK